MKLTSQYICQLLMLPLAVSVLTGCADDPGMGVAATGNCFIQAEIAAPVDVAGARTAVDPTKYTSGDIGIHWAPTDIIGVYASGDSKNVQFQNLSDKNSATTTFNGRINGTETPRYAYYPWHSGAGTDHTALKGTLASVQKYHSVNRSLDNDWKVGTPASGSTNSFKFEHLFAFIRFQISDTGSELRGDRLESVKITIPDQTLNGEFTYNFEDKSISMTGGTDNLTLEWENSPSLNATPIEGFLSCAPVSELEEFGQVNFEITTSRHIASFSKKLRAKEIKKGCYHTVALDLSNEYFTNVEWREDTQPATWLPGLQSGLACANTVFSLPDTPFMHKIRVPEGKTVTRVYDLPEGLTYNDNEKRQLVQGKVAEEGVYYYSVEYKDDNTGEIKTEAVKLTVSSTLPQPTPMMGWQSWNVMGENITHDKLVAQAQKMVDLGLVDLGYKYLGVDDRWSQDSYSRDLNDYPVVDQNKFPQGMKAFTDAIHNLGMKAGIYTDAGYVTCSKANVGSMDFETVDAQVFTEWGFDMLKEDWYTPGQDSKANAKYRYDLPESALTLYKRMGDALTAAGGNILLYMCEWGTHEPWKWAAETGASCWRVTYDVRDSWNGEGNTGTTVNGELTGIGLRNSIDLMRNLWPYNGVNRFNDADMICVGIRGTGKSSNDRTAGSCLTDDENVTAFVMWCMWSSPILLGLDLTGNVLEKDLKLINNKDLIAINQDPMGQAAEWIKRGGTGKNGVDYYVKDLANGDIAIAFVNLDDNQASYSIAFSDYKHILDVNKVYEIYDLVNQKKLTYSLDKDITVGGQTIKPHACAAYRLSPKN